MSLILSTDVGRALTPTELDSNALYLQGVAQSQSTTAQSSANQATTSASSANSAATVAATNATGQSIANVATILTASQVAAAASATAAAASASNAQTQATNAAAASLSVSTTAASVSGMISNMDPSTLTPPANFDGTEIWATKKSGLWAQFKLSSVASWILNIFNGFTQNGTGAVSRPFLGKLQDQISVFDFMTAAQIANVQSAAASIDVTAAVQACINYVSSLPRGGICYFPQGMYLITSTLTVTKPFVKLQGAGMFRTTLVTSTNITILSVGTGPAITGIQGNDVVDIGFYHTNQVPKTVPNMIMLSPLQATVRTAFQNGAYGLVIYGGQGIKLDRIYAPGNYNPALNATLNSSQAITFYAASVASGYTMGAGAVNLPTEVDINSPYINGPLIKGWQYGIAIFAGEHITLTGDYYIGQSTVDNIHIEQDANNQLILETTLNPGGYIDGAGRAGIWIGGPNGNGSQYIGQTSILCVVKGQSGTGLDGIYIDGTNRGGSFPQAVINTVLAPTEVSGWYRHGMNLVGGSGINIPSPNVFGNSFSAAGNGSGIVFGSSVTGARVHGGRSGGGNYGSGTGNQSFGIVVDAASKAVTITSVDVTGNQASMSVTNNAGTSGNRITNCPGFNGNRPANVPALPTTGTSFTNPFGSPAQVLIYGGTTTSINLNGQQVSTTPTSVPFTVGPGDVVSITYSSAPSWIWWPQ